MALAADAYADATADLSGHTDDLTAALGAVDTALRAFCELAHAHNQRVTHWRRQLGQGSVGIGGLHPEQATARVGAKEWRHLAAGRLVGAVVHRVMSGYSDDFLRCDGTFTITHNGDPYGPYSRFNTGAATLPDGSVDLVDLVERSA
jgi:hypothetical protein